MEQTSAIVLIPTLIVLLTAIITHRPVASLIIGVISGILLHSPSNLLSSFSDISIDIIDLMDFHTFYDTRSTKPWKSKNIYGIFGNL